MEHYFLLEEIDMTNLNDEVEIIEDKKIDKIDKLDKTVARKDDMFSYYWNDNEEILANKINEIIDYLKSKGE